MIVALWLAFAVTQDPIAVPGLSLADVYRGAREFNPRAEAARALAVAMRARIGSAKRPPDPQLQLGFMNYTIPGLAPMDAIGMTQLQVMQMLPTPGKLGLSGRVATARASAASERARDAEWDVRASAAMTFYDLYAVDQALRVARETLRLLHDVRSTAEVMYRGGTGKQTDVLRAQVEIARMVEDTVRMTTMRTAMAARLNALVNRAPTTVIGPPALPVYPDSVPPLDALVAESRRQRPMVQAGERELDAAAAQSMLTRRELWPDLTVGVIYGQRGSTMGTERMGSLMLGASIPLFANSKQLLMREEAAAMEQMAAADLAMMRADAGAAVAVAYANLMKARTLSELFRTTVIPQAEATAASAVAAYRVGSVDFMTLLDDRMTVNRYRQELSALESEQGKSWAELEMLVGRELLDSRVAMRASSVVPPKEQP